uniref:Hcy-binding domain-containing protein n=1 Tax=Haemonchus contortus TaxID=6289 RepID=A0A7I4Z5C6_HAECO
MNEQPNFRNIRVLDGSFSTELTNVVNDFFEKDRPNWTFDATIDKPKAVAEVHKRFLDAGVDDIETNTYHACLPSLQRQGFDGPDLIKKAVNILKEVVASSSSARDVRMWGSIGSYAICFRGQAAEYTGAFVDVPPPTDIVKEMTVYHQKQIKAMKDAGMFHMLFETVSSLKEAQAICDALEIHSDVKAVISFTCRKDGLSLRHGESFESAVKHILGNPKIIGFGINCTHPSAISSLLQSVRHIHHNKEVFVYPNSGKHEPTEGEASPMSIILNSIKKWIELGATTIGGCCGIDAKDIGSIRKKVDELNTGMNG